MPLRKHAKILNVEDKVQGDATPAADPVASTMNQSFKSDYKPTTWHTPSRQGDELHDLEDKFQGAVITAADPPRFTHGSEPHHSLPLYE